MSPPELSADAPVADVFVPGLEGLGIARGVELELAMPRITPPPRLRGGGWGEGSCAAGRHRAKRCPRESRIGDFAIPLIAQIRLDWHVAAIAVADAVTVWLHLLQQVVLAEPFDHRGAGFETILAEEKSGVALGEIFRWPA